MADVETLSSAPLATGDGRVLPSRSTLEKLFGGSSTESRASRWFPVIGVSMIIVAAAVICFALFAARPILLPLAAALIISTLLTPIADWLGRVGLPESASAALTVLSAVAVIAGVFFLIGQPAIDWTGKLPDTIEIARDKLEGVSDAVTKVREATEEVEQQISDIAATGGAEVVVKEKSMLGSLTATLRNAGVQIVFTFILVYFLLCDRTSFRIKAMAAQPTLRGKLQVARIFRDTRRKVGDYMLTTTIINFGLGVVMAAAMALIGMPNPIVWGALAAVLNFVPYVGPLLVTLLTAATGIVTFDTLQQAALAPLIYTALNFIESNVVTPSLVGVRMRLSPLAILLFVALLAWLWGPVGAVLAAPLLVILKTVCDSVRFLRPVGVLVGEIDVVKSRRIGFCRIDALGARKSAGPSALETHIVESKRRAAHPKPRKRKASLTDLRRKAMRENAAATIAAAPAGTRPSL